MKRLNGNPAPGGRWFKTWLALVAVSASAWMVTAAATEVYTWTDEHGVVHYSDAPPNQAESEKINVQGMYRPGTSGAYPTSGESAQSGTASGEAVPAVASPAEAPKSVAEQRREEIATNSRERREAREQIDRLCDLHRKRLEQVEPARRVFYTNEAGESVRMDDDQRMALVDESRAFIQENCE